MSLIELTGVRKTYRTGSLAVAALGGITLTIDDGEYVSVMGPSGSGKSTLMHILGCLDVPSEGSYHLAGEDVSAMSEDQLAFNLLASMPAWRNVELPLAYGGVPRAQRRERAITALDRVGLGDRVHHRPGELSGGEQQRVAVARALVTEPALLLADEPTGNLDSASTAEILNLLDELHGSGRTIVVITHEADVARRSKRTVRLLDGLVSGDTATATVTR